MSKNLKPFATRITTQFRILPPLHAKTWGGGGKDLEERVKEFLSPLHLIKAATPGMEACPNKGFQTKLCIKLSADPRKQETRLGMNL